jgi:hypothetical protein
MTTAMLEGRRLRTKATELPWGGEMRDEQRLADAINGSELLRNAILLAKGIVILPLKGKPLPIPKEPDPEPCELCGAPAKPRLLIAHIMATVAAYYDLPTAWITGSQQCAKIARPRQVAMYLSSKLTSHSGAEIARRFKRDHTTVIHAVKVVERRMAEDADVLIDVEVLRERLTP